MQGRKLRTKPYGDRRTARAAGTWPVGYVASPVPFLSSPMLADTGGRPHGEILPPGRAEVEGRRRSRRWTCSCVFTSPLFSGRGVWRSSGALALSRPHLTLPHEGGEEEQEEEAATSSNLFSAFAAAPEATPVYVYSSSSTRLSTSL